MQIEFNPGHRKALEEIGILKPDERYITPEELAIRTLAADKNVEPTTSTLKQQIRHAAQMFLLLDSKFERVIQRHLTSTDQSFLAETRDLLLGLEQKMASIKANAEAIRAYATALKILQGSTDVDLHTIRFRQILGQINSEVEHLLPDLYERERVIRDYLSNLKE